MTFEPLRLRAALERAAGELLAARSPAGHWEGELSCSALSTATAITALATVEKQSEVPSPMSNVGGPLRSPAASREPPSAIQSGLAWLAGHANPDGGWGDTTRSLSNLSTTTLCWAAFGAVPGADEHYRGVVAQAEHWLTERAGGVAPDRIAAAIIRRYGKDRTFSAPILTMCALAGRLGSGRNAWRHVIPLPFELAACPHQWFAALRLPVVSYALPALIAIGQARHRHRPSLNPFARLTRHLTKQRTLKILTNIQPANGGFLEATPLTSFVAMSLAGSGEVHHLVTKRCVEFLKTSQRADGSWPIDTNLATWLTTQAVQALGDVETQDLDLETLNSKLRTQLRPWLLAQQYRVEHPYTHAAPGGWAWTDLPGGVPDADDTAGALLALRQLGALDGEVRSAALAGLRWLLEVQNADGGIPTFCRGWGALPFDRSSADITAHTIRAWSAWLEDWPEPRRASIGIGRALEFLCRTQRTDGSWVPLWFGNEWAPDEENPTYGTARVLLALVPPAKVTPVMPRLFGTANIERALTRGAAWLLATQNADGSWGGFTKGPASVEETALALEALATLAARQLPAGIAAGPLAQAVAAGAQWLSAKVGSGEWRQPAPIGFYFAKLWYYEALYPMIFTVGALKQAAMLCQDAGG